MKSWEEIRHEGNWFPGKTLVNPIQTCGRLGIILINIVYICAKSSTPNLHAWIEYKTTEYVKVVFSEIASTERKFAEMMRRLIAPITWRYHKTSWTFDVHTVSSPGFFSPSLHEILTDTFINSWLQYSYYFSNVRLNTYNINSQWLHKTYVSSSLVIENKRQVKKPYLYYPNCQTYSTEQFL